MVTVSGRELASLVRASDREYWSPFRNANTLLSFAPQIMNICHRFGPRARFARLRFGNQNIGHTLRLGTSLLGEPWPLSMDAAKPRFLFAGPQPGGLEPMTNVDDALWGDILKTFRTAAAARPFVIRWSSLPAVRHSMRACLESIARPSWLSARRRTDEFASSRKIVAPFAMSPVRTGHAVPNARSKKLLELIFACATLMTPSSGCLFPPPHRPSP